MRIPSGLNDDNLYRQRGRRGSVVPGNSPYRKIWRLGLALVLVVFVMREAGKPELYRTLFSAPRSQNRLESSRSTSRELHSDGSAASSRADSDGSKLGPEAALLRNFSDETPLDRTVEVLAPREREELTEFLSAIRRSSANRDESKHKALIAALRDAAALADESLQSGGNAVGTEQPKQTVDLPLLSDERLRNRLQAALDRGYLQSVNDQAIWSKDDRLAFYRLLEDPVCYHRDGGPSRLAGVVNLLQQADVYLHRPVAMQARVARVSLRDAAANPFGIERYWELWMQPLDGSERPVAFYTKELPVDLSKLAGLDFVSSGPFVEVDGLYLKRLAFQSARGTEIAPAIVGRLVYVDGVSSIHPGSVASSAGMTKDGGLPFSITTMIIVAAVIGVGFSITIMIASRIATRRLRRLRQAAEHLPDVWIGPPKTGLVAPDHATQEAE